eukprot:Phypoly_transcript_02088.p1 GENE.Phypoly_transcript_02088~~Phypoly_transcript_02088.p1  ORF type:complete len:970 (+),score=100.19 Phypoly_transcript_02088:343-2910(+)
MDQVFVAKHASILAIQLKILSCTTAATLTNSAILVSSGYGEMACSWLDSCLGIQSTNSTVAVLETVVTSYAPPCNVFLNAVGGSVVMQSVEISAFPSANQYASDPIIYLEDIQQGEFQDFQIAVTGNKLGHPSGIVCVRSSLTLANVTLSGLYATQPTRKASYCGNGGALFIENSNVTMQNCTIKNCQAANGAGMYALNSSVSVTNCTFSNNQGAIFMDSTCSDYSTAKGAGCFLNFSQASFKNAIFVDNSADYGGGLFVNGGNLLSSFNMVSSTVSSNGAYQEGGGVYLFNASSFIANSTILANYAESDGGAVFVRGGEAEFDLCTIANNSALTTFALLGPSITLLAQSNIVNNRGSTFYRYSESATLIVRQSQIEDSDGSFTYCCNNVTLTAPNGELCNYPTCDATCKEAIGCNCPFTSIEVNTNFPVLPSANYTCSCHSDLSDPFCIAEVKNCSVENGGCDWRVACSNSESTTICGDCPSGYTGSGYFGCIALCGNGVCEEKLGENCISCPLDCRNKTCGRCGDGLCDTASETCQNCFEDCQHQCGLTCNSCSSHGECVLGICVCHPPFTGPSCEGISEPISVAPNSTSLTISPADPSAHNISFTIFLRSLHEITENGTEVAFVDAADLTFSLFKSPTVNGSRNQIWNLFSSLPNRAAVNITVIQFTDPITSYTFFSKTQTYSANTVKMNLKISGWPFRSLSNSLEAVIASAGAGEKGNVCSHSRGPSVLWTTLSINGVSLYTHFTQDANVDGRERSISFVQRDQYSISAKFPHFWTFAELDPNFWVLLDLADSCTSLTKQKHQVRKVVTIAVVVPIIGIALIVGVLFLIYVNIKRARTQKKLRELASFEKD